jgi:hypothetical protein
MKTLFSRPTLQVFRPEPLPLVPVATVATPAEGLEERPLRSHSTLPRRSGIVSLEHWIDLNA